jgi:DNA-binding NtrC family response regulator
VLVVDDKPNMLRLMAKVLSKDVDVRKAQSGAEALRSLASESVDVVVCDLKMPDMDGLGVLRAARQLRPTAEFILMTAYATVGTAVEALRAGAYDYITKPFEPEEMRAVVLRAVGRAATGGGLGDSRDELLPGVIGRSRSMQEVAELVRRVAASDATALLLGETGTGKERVARALHHLGRRAAKRFVPINCAAIPAELLESELFGFSRGAFTGAGRDRPGLFEEAREGTLFLDEIGDLRLSLQAKLTRAIEERAIRRIGESHERGVDVRLIAATHRDLEAMVRSDSFRQDLWYRLSVAVIRIPPLRERREDIELLARELLREYLGAGEQRRVVGYTERALEMLKNHDWPGNVRQLRAAIERACIVAGGERIDVRDLPPEIISRYDTAGHETDLASLTWSEAMERGRDEVARRYLEAVLRRSQGKVAEASARAGVERESLYRLMRRYGVDPDAFRNDD